MLRCEVLVKVHSQRNFFMAKDNRMDPAEVFKGVKMRQYGSAFMNHSNKLQEGLEYED